MKAFGFAASVALALGLATSSATKDGQGKREQKFSSNALELAEKFLRARNRNLEHEYNPYDDGAGTGCSCSGDAVKSIGHEHTDATQKLPLVTLALLDNLANGTDPKSISGLKYDPLQNYEDISNIVEELVIYSTRVLFQIDCNACGVDGSSVPTDEDDETRRARRDLGTITPYTDISHYECCCDVYSIRDLVVSRIHDFYEKGLMNPGGDRFMKQAVESLFGSAVEAIQLLSNIYLAEHEAYPVQTPTFPAFN